MRPAASVLTRMVCDGFADDMSDEQRSLWTEQVLQWMCNVQTPAEIRIACGQALAGTKCSRCVATKCSLSNMRDMVADIQLERECRCQNLAICACDI